MTDNSAKDAEYLNNQANAKLNSDRTILIINLIRLIRLPVGKRK